MNGGRCPAAHTARFRSSLGYRLVLPALAVLMAGSLVFLLYALIVRAGPTSLGRSLVLICLTVVHMAATLCVAVLSVRFLAEVLEVGDSSVCERGIRRRIKVSFADVTDVRLIRDEIGRLLACDLERNGKRLLRVPGTYGPFEAIVELLREKLTDACWREESWRSST